MKSCESTRPSIRNVPIPFPEIQEAVDAQLRFAAENPDYEYES